MNLTTKRICKDAILLAILCIIGMFSIPFGENIKVSLQFLIVILICFITHSIMDSLVVTLAYLGLGFLLPIYAGFHAGITPTFGYVIGFVVASVPTVLIIKIKPLNEIVRLAIASIVALLIIYFIGTLFMMLYLNLSLVKTLLVSVVPYIGFDLFKIVVAITIYKILPRRIVE